MTKTNQGTGGGRKKSNSLDDSPPILELPPTACTTPRTLEDALKMIEALRRENRRLKGEETGTTFTPGMLNDWMSQGI
jgi:hypothetical protein